MEGDRLTGMALRTCGDCGFSTLRHCRHPAEVEEYRGTSSIDPDAAPPSWCPLRGRRADDPVGKKA